MAEGHQLIFRIVRLASPRIDLRPGLRLDLQGDMAEDGSESAEEVTDRDLPRYSSRVDLGRAPGGASGILAFPSAFGPVYLGQTFSAAVTLCNVHDAVTHVGVKIDVQTENNKVTLHDTSASPQAVLRAGGRVEVAVHMDVHELGPHTLTCSSFYTDSAGHRHFAPQLFRFSVSNPLGVRTSHRTLSDDEALLEVTLENKTRGPVFLTAVDLVTSTPFKAERVARGTEPATSTCAELIDPTVARYLDSMVLLDGAGSSWSTVYRITRPRASKAGDETAATMGRVDIRWCSAMGESARLQTQAIAAPPRPLRDFELVLEDVPPALEAGIAFCARALVRGLGHPAPGGLAVVMKPSGAGPRPVSLEGEQTVSVPRFEAGGEAGVLLHFVPLSSGRHELGALLLVSTESGAILASTSPSEVFVRPARATSCGSPAPPCDLARRPTTSAN